MFCVQCGEQVDIKRVAAGYKTCHTCGEIQAQKEIKEKQKRTGPLYNKGGYVYYGDSKTTRDTIKTAGKKNAEIAATMSAISSGYNRRKPDDKPRRRIIGFYTVDGQRYAWFEDVTPPDNARHVVRY